MPFCMKCGNVLPEQSKFCGKCGNIVAQAQRVQPVLPQAPVQPMPSVLPMSPVQNAMPYCQPKSRKLWILAAVLVMLAVAVGVGITKSIPYFQAKRLVNLYATALEEDDPDAYLACFIPEEADTIQNEESIIGLRNHQMEYDYGEDFTISCSDFVLKKCTDEKLHRFEELYEDDGIDVKIEALYSVYFNQYVRGDRIGQRYDASAVIGKTKDGWFLMSFPDFYFDDSIDYEEYDD